MNRKAGLRPRLSFKQTVMKKMRFNYKKAILAYNALTDEQVQDVDDYVGELAEKDMLQALDDAGLKSSVKLEDAMDFRFSSWPDGPLVKMLYHIVSKKLVKSVAGMDCSSFVTINKGGNMRQKTSQRRDSAAELLKLRMNNYPNTVDSKAAYILQHVLKGDLADNIGMRCTELGEEEFEHYYGADVDTIIRLCNGLYSADVNQSCLAVIAAAEELGGGGGCGLMRDNYHKLYEAGIPELIPEFASGFRGRIVKVYDLRDDRHVIQTVSNDHEKQFYFSSDLTFGFNEFDHAVLFGMFGKDHFHTVIKLHDVIKTQ